MTVEVEVYEQYGVKMLWIGTENGSGCKYELDTLSLEDIGRYVLEAATQDEECEQDEV